MKLGRQNSTPRTQTPTISAVLSLLKYIMAGVGLRVVRGVCRSPELGARFERGAAPLPFFYAAPGVTFCKILGVLRNGPAGHGAGPLGETGRGRISAGPDDDRARRAAGARVRGLRAAAGVRVVTSGAWP